MRIWPILLLLPALTFAGDIYTRDGVTDGDTFYLAPHAYTVDDPVYAVWVTYSLMKSACQLEIGGPNPARASSFDCEFRSRRAMVNDWLEKQSVAADLQDDYLDTLADVDAAGFLAEYTVKYFGKKHWQVPEGLRLSEFKQWRKHALRRHKPVTRITGSWNFQPENDS